MKKYEIVEEYILGRIKSGEYKHRDKLESVEELCERFGVSHITVQKALSELSARGIIVRVKGAGTFINCETDSGLRKNISVIIPVNEDYPDSSILTIAKGAKKRADELGYNMMLELCNDTPSGFYNSVENAIAKGANAIAMYVLDIDAAVNVVRRYDMPLVMIDLFDDQTPCAGVTVNNSDGEFIAVKYLLSRGHRRIGFFGADMWKNTEKARYNGYLAAMKQADNEENARVYLYGSIGMSEIADDIRNGKLTAVASVNDQIALALMKYLANSGISVPSQCSIIGFDDHDSAKYSPIPLTTVKQNFPDVGACAIELLDEQLKGSCYMYRKVFSPVRLVERESVVNIEEK